MHKHFTATAFIVDAKKRTLLLWHRRLQRWMPPGGHIDPDETPEETALRECREETGLHVEIIGQPQEDVFQFSPLEGHILKKPFALLLENIPASTERGEPAHQHMDFVYLARPQGENQSLALAEAEGEQMRWFSAEEVASLDPKTEIYRNVQTYILSVLK